MIERVEMLLRAWRRGMSRSEWLARLLGLPASPSPADHPGLILIQIDGLSQREFEIALKRGELPTLRRLLDREHYEVHRLYSGLPSTTPAVQGELFYGIRAAVPAFNFRENETGNVVVMYEPEAAVRVERLLAAQGGEPLLAEGSSYSNVYAGGAAEAHFCPAAVGWGETIRKASPLATAILWLSNIYSFLRIGALLLLEFILAIVDFARGIYFGQNFFKELKFIPTRVAICILLRELIVIGVKMDIARGLPVIHMNFLGYDEQAHRRGPHSLFAHWTLKGIDDAAARIWRASQRSSRRVYDVWIYSDHGQETSRPYPDECGRTLHEAVAAACRRVEEKGKLLHAPASMGIQTRRSNVLGGNLLQRVLYSINGESQPSDGASPDVVALGPIGFIYPPQPMEFHEIENLALELVRSAAIPLVAAKDDAEGVRAWSPGGVFSLPDQAAEVFGQDHPFLEEVSRDFVALCRHPDAGALVLCGWRRGAPPLSFVQENGAHCGAAPCETGAFALLPSDAPVPARARQRGWLRPDDLRQAALCFQGRSAPSVAITDRHRRTASGSAQRVLRVLTYNVHRCIGMDGRLSPQRISRVIARCNPDIVALQELDVGRARTGGIDQAHQIAHYLEMDFHFHPAIHLEEEKYGDAILSPHPMRLIKAGPLPSLPDRPSLEPRGALWVAVEFQGTTIQIVNTHLGLLAPERKAQVEALLGDDWLGSAACRAPVILCGDFNALPGSRVCKRLGSRLKDAQRALDRHRPKGTFFGRIPAVRIDHIFVDTTLEVIAVDVAKTRLARVASDHLPLLAEVRLPSHDPPSAPPPPPITSFIP